MQLHFWGQVRVLSRARLYRQHNTRCCSLTHFAKTCKVVYRHYATLYFVFIVDEQESELGILDLVQGTALLITACDRSLIHCLPAQSLWRPWTRTSRTCVSWT